MKITLRFGSEYLASPLFNTSIDDMGHEHMESLGLPIDLLNEIFAWDHRFQETYCDEYPPDSGFKTDDEARLHNEEGLRLCQALQDFFGPQYIVEYVPYR